MVAVVNFLVGLVLGFLLCAWGLETSPIDAFGEVKGHAEPLVEEYIMPLIE